MWIFMQLLDTTYLITLRLVLALSTAGGAHGATSDVAGRSVVGVVGGRRFGAI